VSVRLGTQISLGVAAALDAPTACGPVATWERSRYECLTSSTDADVPAHEVGRIGQMTGGDLLWEATAVFVRPGRVRRAPWRSGGLGTRGGDASTAKRTTGLRKPTRSAWILNQLVRSAPAVTAQLAALGEQLRAAQRSLEGAAIREPSLQRRQLIDALARQAFTVSGAHAPSAACWDEVTATLGASWSTRSSLSSCG
jgi:hypothetical protein